MSSIRFDGIYGAADSPLFFRLMDDGSAGARFVRGGPTPRQAAQVVWPGFSGYGTGRFEESDGNFRLHLSFPSGGERLYAGKLVPEGIDLHFIDKGKEFPSKLYSFHHLTADELVVPQAALVHALRLRLDRGEVERHRVLAAATVGEVVARLALQPAFDVAGTAQLFASFGSASCVRLLLALSWSDDGNFFRPKQSISTGGGRGDDEGKVLRALAKWVLKPDAKTLTKAEELMSSVVKVGADFAFLKLALQVANTSNESERSSALNDALAFHIDQDPYLASEEMQKRIVPWLMGGEDWLAEHLKRIK